MTEKYKPVRKDKAAPTASADVMSRCVVEETPNGLVVTIPTADLKGGDYANLLGAIPMLATIGAVPPPLVTEGMPVWANVGSFAVYALTLLLMAFTLTNFVWKAFGRWVVTVDGLTLAVRREVLRVGWNSLFPLRETSRLRFTEVPEELKKMKKAVRPKQWEELKANARRIEFEYAGKTRYFGVGLPPTEAHAAITAIVSLYPGLASVRPDA